MIRLLLETCVLAALVIPSGFGCKEQQKKQQRRDISPCRAGYERFYNFKLKGEMPLDEAVQKLRGWVAEAKEDERACASAEMQDEKAFLALMREKFEELLRTNESQLAALRKFEADCNAKGGRRVVKPDSLGKSVATCEIVSSVAEPTVVSATKPAEGSKSSAVKPAEDTKSSAAEIPAYEIAEDVDLAPKRGRRILVNVRDADLADAQCAAIVARLRPRAGREGQIAVRIPLHNSRVSEQNRFFPLCYDNLDGQGVQEGTARQVQRAFDKKPSGQDR